MENHYHHSTGKLRQIRAHQRSGFKLDMKHFGPYRPPMPRSCKEKPPMPRSYKPRSYKPRKTDKKKSRKQSEHEQRQSTV